MPGGPDYSKTKQRRAHTLVAHLPQIIELPEVLSRVTGLHRGFIFCDSTRLALDAKRESPEYVAAIECVPTESTRMEKVATLFDVVPVPITLPAS